MRITKRNLRRLVNEAWTSADDSAEAFSRKNTDKYRFVLEDAFDSIYVGGYAADGAPTLRDALGVNANRVLLSLAGRLASSEMVRTIKEQGGMWDTELDAFGPNRERMQAQNGDDAESPDYSAWSGVDGEAAGDNPTFTFDDVARQAQELANATAGGDVSNEYIEAAVATLTDMITYLENN